MASWRKKQARRRETAQNAVSVSPWPMFAGHRIHAQQMIDALADIANVPLAMLHRPDLHKLYEKYRLKHKYFRDRFKSSAEFREFVAAANHDPRAVVLELDRERTSWRDIFVDFLPDLFVTRQTWAEPVIRLLRDHWSWRWAEALALYDKLLQNDVENAALGFYESFSSGVWFCTVTPCDENNNFLLLGPIKNKDRSAQLSAQLIDQFVKSYYELIKRHVNPIHSVHRFEQFFYDRASIYKDEFFHLKNVLSQSLRLIRKTTWPSECSPDSVDIMALSEFTYFVADLLGDPWTRISPDENGEFSISYYYPLFLQNEKHEIRQLLFISLNPELINGDAFFSIGHLSLCKVKIKESQHPKPLYFKMIRSASYKRYSQVDINEHINNRFEQLARRRRVTQSQRLLEELLILRYRLADSFGVLTADDSLQSASAGERLQDRIARRIARVAAQICNADSAVIYRYDHRNRVLVAAGSHIQYIESADEPNDYKWMRDVGSNTELRERSVSYTAADRDSCVSYNEGTDFPPLMYNISSLIPPPQGSRIPRGRSLIAIPIRVFGRLWGVFELVSTETNAFSYVQIEQMQKVCDLIGPFYHEQFMLNTLYHMASPLENAQREGQQFDLLAQQAADIFLCGSACIWVRDLINADQYNCVGITGRRDLATLRKGGLPLPSFNGRSSDSIAIEAIRSRKIWVAGQIGADRFSGTWLNKAHTRSLVEEGYKFIAITPVYDLDEHAIAVISVYSTSRAFSHNWESWAKYIGSYMGVMITRVHNVRDMERRARRVVAHEIVNALRNVRGSKNKIFDFVRTIPSSVDKPGLLRIWMSDVDTHLNDIEAGMADWAGDAESDVANRIEVVVLATAEARAKTQPPSDVSFRMELNTCAQSLGREMHRHAIELKVNYPRYNLVVRMHPENLRMILNNLIANAVKYSPNGSAIHCGFLEQKYGIRFFIRNIGSPLAEGESLRIFDLGFRGAGAHDVQGSGLGLFIVKKICNFYDIEVSYEPAPLRTRNNNVWHQFNVDFPREIVVEGGWFA